MTYEGPTREPEDDGLFRRGLFARREPSPAEPQMTPTEYRLAETLTRTVDQRVDDGVRTLEEQATALLREVATEVWRTSAKDVRPEQERIMTLLARDQAIRSLILSSDERFQALAVRTARLEDHLQEVTESERRTRDAMESSAAAIREIADSPTLHGVDIVRTQLEMVERHIAEAFAHMDARDKHLTETVLQQVREHGELIANETTRVVEAMQSYVQGGAEAVGRLAQRIEEHAQQFVLQDHDIQTHVRALLDDQTTDLTEQLSLVRETVGLRGREQAELRAAVERLIDARIRGLAELVRSDSIALQRLLEERLAAVATAAGETSPIDEDALVRMIDDRLATMGAIVAERIGQMERSVEEQVLALSTAMTGSVERNLERMSAAAGAVDGLDEMVAETQAAFEERIMGEIDERVTALAKLIRSDNHALAERLRAIEPTGSSGGEPADAELLRQVLRSVKELQAGMTSDVQHAVDMRFQAMADQLHREGQSQAETMLKVAEMLSGKIDRLSVRVDEGVGTDLQIVVDRMSDAIRAMSTVRREAS
jgi:hypothetical protein